MKEFIAAVIAIVASLGFGIILGSIIEHRMMTRDAIDHGVAEYRVDSKTGATEFVWIKPKAKKEPSNGN